MIIQKVDNINTDIVIGNFQLKCVVEALRVMTAFECEHVQRRLKEHGFVATLSEVQSEITNFVTTSARFMDNFQKVIELDEPESKAATAEETEKKPFVM